MNPEPQNQNQNTASRLIAMAASLLGSTDEVQVVLRCSQSDFQMYRDGVKEPSWPELDRLVAVIVREQGTMIARNRELRAAIRRKRPLRG